MSGHGGVNPKRVINALFMTAGAPLRRCARTRSWNQAGGSFCGKGEANLRVYVDFPCHTISRHIQGNPMTVQYQIHQDVAVISLAHPPMNGLNFSTRLGVVQALQRAASDAAVVAIVLTGAGKVFCSGADITEFGSASAFQEPNLRTVIEVLESAAKPVVAALHGVAMGGGLELALGCHYRIAAPGCGIALPEVKLGLLPGAGGTQRMPRAIGVEPALNMILSGETIACEKLASIPDQKLFDRIAATPAALLEEAVAFAREAAARHAAGHPLPLVRELPCEHPMREAYFQFVRNMVEGMAANAPALPKCVDAVQAAVQLPFAAGLEKEISLFRELMETPQSIAQRHVFLAERAASRIADVPDDTPVRDIRSVAVIGAGTMGTGIAMNFLNAGVAVTILDTQQQSLDRGLAIIRKNYETQVEKRKLKPEEYERRMALLRTALDYPDVAQADLVIEAVFEDLAVKEAVFRQLDAVLKPGAILASNTSTLDLNRLAALTSRPQDVVGLHFFSPAHVMRLLEVVRGGQTAQDVLATVMALGKKIRKTCVVSGVCDGFIGNRMLDAYFRQAGFLLDEGCSPQQVDKAMEKFGFAMGPFRMSDMAGNDIGWYIRKRRYIERPDIAYSKNADLLCEMGRFGQKTEGGWYDYVPGKRDALPSQVVADLLQQYRQSLGIEPRRIADEEIVQRLVYALVNEGAHIREEGIAGKAGDIDVVYITGYGFPAWRGGPMHYAGQAGLWNVREAMRRFAGNPVGDQAFWQPAPLIAKLADEGRTFAD
jgi:3-hydroxyacyl-CoA dehydrogenase